MSSRNGNHRVGRLSLRGRLTFFSALTGGIVSTLVAIAVVTVSYRYLIGDVNAKLDRIGRDLRGEYAEFGVGPAFFHCVDDDAEEHNPKVTFVVVTDATNGVVKVTDIPIGYRERLLRLLARGRYDGRFLTERHGVEDEDRGAVRYRSCELHDGGHVTVARDVSALEGYLIFLVVTLAGGAVLTTFLSGLCGYVIGGRVLKLNQLVAEKDRAYGELRRLTDDIAHDLRTPLTRLSMAAETAAVGGDLREPLPEMVVGEAGSMLELINTMLDISQTDAKIDRTPREKIDLAAFVRYAGEVYSAAAEEAGLGFAIKVPEAPVLFSGHKGKLQQLLGNLLDNALKFTPAGGKVEVALAETGEFVRLTVSDTGCGLSPADIPHIFRRFWRADSSRHLRGNGLGLALVHAIVTSYGGKITCTSSLGHGTTFTVFLPL